MNLFCVSCSQIVTFQITDDINHITQQGFILLQLKQEYGYAINPLDPQFAEKIAAKEKEYSKKAKEEKKKMRQEKKAAFAEPKAEEEKDAQNES